MKLVVVMNLSPRLCELLRGEGFDAVHWSTVGAGDAADAVLMAWARDHDRVLVTHDLDFGVLLAASGDGGPSVVQVRTQAATPEALLPLLLSVLEQHGDAIEAGALVTVDEAQARVRVLPL